MKIKNIRYFLAFAFLFSVLWIGCRTPDSKQTPPTAPHVQPHTSSQTADTDELSFLDLLPQIDTNVFYLATLTPENAAPQQFIFSVSNWQKRSFVGTIIPLSDTTHCVVTPSPLHGKIKHRRCFVQAFNQEKFVKKIQLFSSHNGVKGKLTLDDIACEFVITPYQTPDYQEYKNRYQEPIFSYTILKNVKYGEAMGYWTSNETGETSYLKIFAKGISASAKKKPLDLRMDIYLPEGDSLPARPLLLLFHGGAFYIGDKASAPIVLWCKYFAARGYVVASVNYRMGFPLTKSGIERCGYSAVQDAHAAVRFLLSKKAEYRINPDYIFSAGSSAGGITALNLTFMRNATRPQSSYKHGVYNDLGNLETSGNTLRQPFHIRAVANMWGAVHDLAMLNAANTAVISFHGDADRLVPYDTGIPFSDMKIKIGGLFFDTMYGSAAIHRKIKQLGYRNELHTFPNAGHAPHVNQADEPTKEFYYIQEHIRDFFYTEFVPTTVSLTHDPARPQWFQVDDSGIQDLHWKITGGFLIETAANRARAIFTEGQPHELTASVRWKNGASKIFVYHP